VSPSTEARTITCVWCGHVLTDAGSSTRCPRCQLFACPTEDPTKGGTVDPVKARQVKRNRGSTPRKSRLNLTPVGLPVLGLDPGGRYTGVVIRDGDVPLLASTLVRPERTDPTEWARTLPDRVRAEIDGFSPVATAIEGLRAPKGFKGGARASLNPEHVMNAAITLGALAHGFPDALIVPPGGNGSQHYTHYPASLLGRRPKDLLGSSNGAKSRAHEQSAYDIAGRGSQYWQRQKIAQSGPTHE